MIRSVLDLFEEYDIPWVMAGAGVGWSNWSPLMHKHAVEWGLSVLPADGSFVQEGDLYYDEAMLKLIGERARR